MNKKHEQKNEKISRYTKYTLAYVMGLHGIFLTLVKVKKHTMC